MQNTYHIQMGCQSCVRTIQSACATLSDIKETAIDLTAQQLTVHWKNEPNVNQLKETLMSYGYQLGEELTK